MSTQVGPRYVVVGAGAVGGVLAAHLAAAGRDVVLVARGEHGRRIAYDGLVVRRPTGVDVVDLPVVAEPAELQLRVGDVLVLTVKTQDADAAITAWAWRPVVDDSGTVVGPAAAVLPVVTYQNGIATEDLALRRFARVYGATIGVSASYLVPGEIVSPSLDPAALVWIGRYPSGTDAFTHQLTDDLNAGGIAAFPVEEIRSYKATKLIANLANNGLDLFDGPNEVRERARGLLRDEALEVFAASGVAVLPGATLAQAGVPTLQVQPVDGHEGGHLSTWQSVQRGSSTEIDFLNGEIVLLARRHGLSAPFNERLQTLVSGGAHGATLEDLLQDDLLQDDLTLASNVGSR